MTEIGNFPDEWKIKNLVEIADFETGKRMKGGGLEEGDVISLGGEHISEDGRIQFKKLKFISNSFYNGLKKGKLHNNDILIVKDGARTGKVAISKGLDQKIAINEHIFLIRTKNPNICNNLFLFFILFSHIGQIQVKKAYHGLIGGITREDLSNFLIPLPPLSEQRAIAHLLRTVQEAREKTEAVIEAAKALKKSMMQYLFTYGPVPIDEAEQVPLKETEIGMVPEVWEIVRLGDFFKISSGGTPSRKESQYWNGDIPWIKTGEINYSIITSTEESITKIGLENSAAKIIPAGTIVMAMYGQGVTRGRVAITCIDAAINQAVAALFPKENINKRYAFYYFVFSYENIRSLGHGAHQTNLSGTIIKTIKIPIPSIPIQEKIAHILMPIDQKIAAEESRKAALDQLFQTLLHDLMTAKIRVNHLSVPVAET
ncbi:MAG: restriction endonuclease subunit S [Methanoregulaceae archaeon]|nr:restriction endonuclease subunit S [Methanoregulaceae archaeon]